MKIFAEGELLSASDLNDNFAEAEAKAAYAATYTPMNLGNTFSNNINSQTVIGWVDCGVLDYARLITIMGKVDASVPTGSASTVLIASVFRVESSFSVGSTFNPSNGMNLMQARAQVTGNTDVYLPVLAQEFKFIGDTETKYVLTAYRSGASMSVVNGYAQTLSVSWSQVTNTNGNGAITFGS